MPSAEVPLIIPATIIIGGPENCSQKSGGAMLVFAACA